jgi:DNA-binding transcriptional regulator YiaG
MPNIASVLKEEITRLARKEVRSTLEKTRKTTLLHRREIAALRGQVSELKRQVTALEKASRGVAAPAQPPDAAESVRFAPKGLTSTRKRLGLSVAALAKMMSVSDQTIYNWERGVTKPRPEQRIKLASLRKIGKREMQEHLTARRT